MEIPPRTVTDAYLASRGVPLDIAFDVDLGELTRGHHIVARGIMFGRPVRVPKRDPARFRALTDASDNPNNGGGFIRAARNAESAVWEERLTGAELHYEIVPGLSETEAQLGGFDWNWTLTVTDDAGTEYADYNGGAFDTTTAQTASHGTRDLGGQIPPQATRLTLRFQAASGWKPPGPWHRQIDVDLHERRLTS